MQIFGLISLLITFALAGWFFLKPGPSSSIPDPETAQMYRDVLDQAESVTNQVSPRGAVTTEKIEIYNGNKFAKDVQTVDLSGRGFFGSLKAEVRLLTELKELDISDNKFTALPAEIGQLSKLEMLDVSNNPLTGLPYELGNLKNLKRLDLRGTDYSWRDLEIIKASLPETTIILID